ncbi:VQ motif-containing protein 20-like [Mercurialis annua]|uniref:VQ motif-containing protein 20-like n=1 Tax=Mercurialis annua TaxID=3986 RepID=UPI002160787E|nr:VQ motif-containing protein 20-like [Mercurialis annua]
MSPANFNDTFTNGQARPSPLKISKASHLIHKQSSNSPNSSSSSFSNNFAPVPKTNPVIIYTHSPKVIHTQARDFMALVQKLTGLSSSRNDSEIALHQPSAQQKQGVRANNIKPKRVNRDDNENCNSILTVDNSSGGCGGDNGGCGGKNPYFTGIPLFTQSNYYCSPKPVYRYSDHSAVYASSPSIGANSMSPSVLEFMKLDYQNIN